MDNLYLIAQTPMGREANLRAMQEQFSNERSGGANGFLVVFGLLVAAFILMVVLDRLRQRKKNPILPKQPNSLFRRVLRKLHLSWAQRHCLRKLARTLHLEHPTTLLISANYFDDAVQRYCSKLPSPPLQKRASRRLSAIRLELFGFEGIST